MRLDVPAKLLLLLGLSGACAIEDIDHAGDDDDFPVRMATAYCAALFACDPVNTCTLYEAPPPYATEGECIDAEREVLEQVRSSARSARLTYDADCVDATIARYEVIGCQGRERLEALDVHLSDECPPYHGALPEGEDTCAEIVGSELSDCGAGLVCVDSICESGSTVASCDCDEGFGCIDRPQEGSVCAPIVAAGDSCHDETGMENASCGVDGWCRPDHGGEGSPTGTCEPRAPLGASCDAGACSSYACDAGVCSPASPYLCWDAAAPRRWAADQ